ncbi:MAG: hypothetical protein JO171_01335 [Paludibacterium sp.]|uniref:amino acid kinase family protein n=1 Tax=Paludibacterium sp. TaxID=1917523 RepID=UPI0025FC8EE4|nr:hypothetical protein [Paludibacterium sp.]MBV8045769.1 hypothetical protein [Paludibacterium sp.]MBV8649249.1 hypothetical protein [Paludibacterium sp.]
MSVNTTETSIRHAQLLRESRPFIHALHGQTVVVGFLGATLSDLSMRLQWMQDIALLALLGARPLLVHGVPWSGHAEQPSPAAQRAAMTEVNVDLVRLLNREGARAVGLNGQDAHWALASDQNEQGLLDADTALIQALLAGGMIPALMACAPDVNEAWHSLPSERFAAQVAQRLQARALVLVSEEAPSLWAGMSDGMMDRRGAATWLAAHERDESALAMRAAMAAADGGVSTVHWVDAHGQGGLIAELLTSEGEGAVLCRRGSTQVLNDTARYFSHADSVIRPNFVAEHKWVVRF